MILIVTRPVLSSFPSVSDMCVRHAHAHAHIHTHERALALMDVHTPTH